MDFLKEHLDVLELDALPDLATLQSHFNRLIKLYHPDRNRDRSEWATEQTRRLIESQREIKRYLIRTGQFNGATGYAERARASSHSRSAGVSNESSSFRRSYNPGSRSRTDRVEDLFSDFFDDEDRDFWGDEFMERFRHAASRRPVEYPANESDSGSVRVHLIRSPAGDLAVPLDSIVQVLSYRHSKILEHGDDRRYAIHEEEIYPLESPGHTHNAETSPKKDPGDTTGIAYILLYRSRRVRAGILLPHGTDFGDIVTFNAGEVVMVRSASPGAVATGILYYHKHPYYIAGELLGDFLERSGRRNP